MSSDRSRYEEEEPSTSSEEFRRARSRHDRDMQRGSDHYPTVTPWFEVFENMNVFQNPRRSAPQNTPPRTPTRTPSRRVTDSSPFRLRQQQQGRLTGLCQLFPLDPPSPTESEERTPPVSPNRTPTPPRSPPPPMKEHFPIPPPNSPIQGIPYHAEQLAMDYIEMGFGWAHSWIDHVKPLKSNDEDRISLPRIFTRVPRKTLIMLVAHKNVDETLFHKVEIPYKTEKKMRKALSKLFKVRMPFHRLRLSISEQTELPLCQAAIDRFESVEYFRLDTTYPNHWVIYHIVNASSSS
uniref:Uncharacterized protein n=1 Tax=Caenorhabditis japonica TaxID=281687 RepID=A0A8R1DZI4_CAEJA